MKTAVRPFIETSGHKETGIDFWVDGVSLKSLENREYSPVYVTALSAIKDRVLQYQKALTRNFPRNHLYYAVKANFAEPVLRAISSCGSGADIVSIGEWRACTKNNVFTPQKICFAGVGKTPLEIREALAGGVGTFNVEHVAELDFLIKEIEGQQKNHQTHFPLIAVRLNPCVESDTHPHLKTGALDSKFGILLDDLRLFFQGNMRHNEQAKKCVRGIHVHIGSQLMNAEVFHLVMQKVCECALMMHEYGFFVDHVDLGGGLGVGFEGVPLDASDIHKHVDFISNALKKAVKSYSTLQQLWGNNCENLNVCLEPGRSVVASSTVFFTKVLYFKKNADAHVFTYVDGAMNDFPRPSLYGAKHQVLVAKWARNRTSNSPLFSQKIVGPVCESGDILAQQVLLPEMDAHDVLAFMEAGAYCRSMASHYNLRILPAEIFVEQGTVVHVNEPLLPR